MIVKSHKGLLSIDVTKFNDFHTQVSRLNSDEKDSSFMDHECKACSFKENVWTNLI